MAVANGFGKTVTSGSVFMYDTGDTVNSYIGEPTTNLISSTGIDMSELSTYSLLSRSQVADSSSPSGYACEMTIDDGATINSASRIRFGNATNIPTSGNVFVSVWVKLQGGPTSNIIPRIYTGFTWYDMSPLDGGSQYITSQYRRFGVYVQVGTNSSGPNPAFSMTHNNSSRQTGQKTRWHSPQVEQKARATPFTIGTRSATQGLLPIVGNSTIDLSNVSFDSNAQMVFDGTDDSISLAAPSVTNSVGFSVELILKPNNTSTSPMVIVPQSGGIDHFIRFSSNGSLYMRMIIAEDSTIQDFTTTSVLSSSNYHHVVFTFKQSEGGKAFYNGNLESSASANFTALNWTSNWRLGQRGNNTFFYQGEIPVTRIYNRALSAAEVKQNYNKYKSRFNLS